MKRSAEQNTQPRYGSTGSRGGTEARRDSKHVARAKSPILQQPGRARDSWDNRSARGDSSGSNVEDVRNRLKALRAPVWGTEAQMWPHAEARREFQKRDEGWLADRARERAEAEGQGELREPRAPDEPQLRNEHAMKSHTYRDNCGVHCMVRPG